MDTYAKFLEKEKTRFEREDVNMFELSGMNQFVDKKEQSIDSNTFTGAETTIAKEKFGSLESENGLILWDEENKNHEYIEHRDKISNRIDKYSMLAQSDNQEIKDYSARYTNHSARKRRGYANSAQKQYYNYQKKYEELKRIKRTNDKKDAKTIKSFYKSSIELIDLRAKAMISGAQVKSTSSANEKFRITKINCEILGEKINLAEKYADQYAADAVLSTYFIEQKNSYMTKLEKMRAEYEKQFYKTRGEGMINCTDVVRSPVNTAKEIQREYVPEIEEIEKKKTKNSSLRSVRDQVDSLKKAKYGTKEQIFQKIRRENMIKLHNDYNNSFLLQGEKVIQFDIRGTQDKIHDNGYNETEMHNEYGDKLEVLNNKEGIREKKQYVEINDQTEVEVDKIVVSGAGLLNLGEFSIEDNCKSVLKIAQSKLIPIFQSWKEGGVPKNLHFSMKGLSRGAVNTGLAAMTINGWVAENYPQYEKYIMYDVVQFDPVPGSTVRTEYDKIRYGGAANSNQELDKNGFIKGTKYKPLSKNNTNSTVFYSMHPDMGIGSPFLQPQCVLGANRIILHSSSHTDDYSTVRLGGPMHIGGPKEVLDNKDIEKTEYFYNSSNGEYYSTEGVQELDEGVYILDEYDILTKVDNFEDAKKVLLGSRNDKLYSSRENRLLYTLKDWFANHS